MTKRTNEWHLNVIRMFDDIMTRPLAKQLFTVFLGGTLEPLFSEQKMLMNMINLPKQIIREITAAGNPTLRIQHDAFTAIMLFNHKTQQLSSAMLRLEPQVYQDMLAYAQSKHWLQTQSIKENTLLEWRHDDTGLSQKLVLLYPESDIPEISVAFFDYPGIFDAHTVHFRREYRWAGSAQLIS